MARRSRPGPRAIAAAAGLGALAAGAALERRHLHAIARDEDYRRLRAPLGGRPRRVTSADGTELYAETFGPDEAETVVLAHGWTEQISFWGPVIGCLRDDAEFRVVAYDLRGHGRSAPAADGDYALERFGEDLEAVLAAAGADAGSPATLVGHSLGAMSMAAWAERHDPRARARAAVLVNTGLGDLVTGHLLIPQIARFLNHPRASWLLLGSRAPMPPFSTPLQQALIRYAAFGPTATMGDIAFYERMLVECPANVRAACGVALSDMDLRHAVASLTIPTLVVAGADDRLTPPAHARRIAEDLPVPAGLVELPDTGHMSPLERPRELCEVIGQLMRDTRPAAAAAHEAVSFR